MTLDELKVKDYYAILGVKRDAEFKTIKAAFEKGATKENFDLMKEAYEGLRKPDRRQGYNEFLDLCRKDWNFEMDFFSKYKRFNFEDESQKKWIRERYPQWASKGSDLKEQVKGDVATEAGAAASADSQHRAKLR